MNVRECQDCGEPVSGKRRRCEDCAQRRADAVADDAAVRAEQVRGEPEPDIVGEVSDGWRARR